MMEIGDGGLPGIRVWTPRRYHDARGYFFELMRESTEALLGEGVHFVQDNVSRSRRGVIRGLHYQDPAPQGKLVCVLEGEEGVALATAGAHGGGKRAIRAGSCP